MINYKEAKKILIRSKIKIKDEIINSSKSLNRINVIDIYSAVNYPAGTNAAFDGFAINSKDTNKLNKSNSFLTGRDTFKIVQLLFSLEADCPLKEIDELIASNWSIKYCFKEFIVNLSFSKVLEAKTNAFSIPKIP